MPHYRFCCLCAKGLHNFLSRSFPTPEDEVSCYLAQTLPAMVCMGKKRAPRIDSYIASGVPETNQSFAAVVKV
jgi:hypothetical protein